jgi:hypothetical protein
MALKWRCNLDAAGVLTGYEQIDDSAAQIGDVLLDDQPDLAVGEYRWNGDTFVPARSSQLFAPDGPDAWYAIYRFMLQEARKRKAENTEQLPAPCLNWIDYYRNSFTKDDPI